jgi:hypothetical protein
MNDKEAPEEFNLGETAKIWAAAVLAPAWYEDALREAAIRDWGARRREIILSVCFAETYLYEFVRDTFIQQPNEIYEFFPIDDRRGVYDRWRDVSNKLLEDKKLVRRPDYGAPHGTQWCRLLDFRDGLVHANASRPESGDYDLPLPPEPRIQDLRELPKGWAIDTAVERVVRLHQASKQPIPSWIRA